MISRMLSPDGIKSPTPTDCVQSRCRRPKVNRCLIIVSVLLALVACNPAPSHAVIWMRLSVLNSDDVPAVTGMNLIYLDPAEPYSDEVSRPGVTAQASYEPLHFRLFAQALTTVGGTALHWTGQRSAVAELGYRDTISFSSLPDGMPASTEFSLNWRLYGTGATLAVPGVSGGHLLQTTFGDDTGNYEILNNEDFGTLDTVVRQSFSLAPGVEREFFGSFAAIVWVWDSATDAGGASTVNFGQTITLESITLPEFGDVTPESLGIEFAFGSGLPSPNLAIAEPSSLVVWLGIGAVSLFGYGWRRKAGGMAVGQDHPHPPLRRDLRSSGAPRAACSL